MLIPEHWAEARATRRARGRQVTVRRFGWSNASAAEAAAMARARADDALGRAMAGEDVLRREPRVAYSGADGVPIREEIVARHEGCVITRNAYGARCLNAPDVLFADVDFASERGSGVLGLSVAGVSIALAVYGVNVGHGAPLFVAIAASAVAAWMFVSAVPRLRAAVFGSDEARALRRVERFVRARPEWNVRVYRTPAGLRVLAMHRTFDPSEPDASALFRALHADPVYVRMCERQRCFRARVSPKPWRIGVSDHLRPRPGVWPVAPERRAERERWVAAYDQASEGYASCRFVASFGQGGTHPSAERVRRLHDLLARSATDLPLA